MNRQERRSRKNYKNPSASKWAWVILVSLFCWLVIIYAVMGFRQSVYTVPDLEDTIRIQKNTINDQYKETHKLYKQIEDKETKLKEYEKQIKELHEKVDTLQNKINKIGATAKVLPSRSKSLRVLDGFQVTHYNLKGTTASGRQVSNTTIAVDPKVIPLGTWVELRFPDGSVIKRRAEDTGRLIQGKIIDLWVDADTQTTYEMGRIHNVQVRILGRDE